MNEDDSSFCEAFMTTSSRLTAVISMGAVLALGMNYGMAASQSQAPHYPTRLVWAGVYTQAQAARGQVAYAQSCSRCHRDDLSGGEKAPSLKGSAFFDRWHDLALFDVLAKIQSAMPHDTPTVLPADTARDIVTFLLRENGVPAGDKELSADVNELADILITSPSSRAK